MSAAFHNYTLKGCPCLGHPNDCFEHPVNCLCTKTGPCRYSTAWSMPNRWTFEQPPVADFLARWLAGCEIVVDPFSGRSTVASMRNDLGEGGVDAEAFCTALLPGYAGRCDAVLFDPPYSTACRLPTVTAAWGERRPRPTPRMPACTSASVSLSPDSYALVGSPCPSAGSHQDSAGSGAHRGNHSWCSTAVRTTTLSCVAQRCLTHNQVKP